VTAQALLNRFVNDAHPTIAEPAEDPEIAQLARDFAGIGGIGLVGSGLGGDSRRLGQLHLDQEGKQFADLVGQLRVPGRVVRNAGPLAAADSIEKRVGYAVKRFEPFESLAVGDLGSAHFIPSPG